MTEESDKLELQYAGMIFLSLLACQPLWIAGCYFNEIWDGDKWVMVRQFLNHVPKAVVGMLLLNGAVLFANHVTKGVLLAKVLETSYGCAAVLCALILGNAFILCFS